MATIKKWVANALQLISHYRNVNQFERCLANSIDAACMLKNLPVTSSNLFKVLEGKDWLFQF